MSSISGTFVSKSASIQSLPESLRPLFWDVDFPQLDVARHRWFIAERLLEKTTPQAFRWLLDNYTDVELLQLIRESRRLGERDRNYWERYLAAH